LSDAKLGAEASNLVGQVLRDASFPIVLNLKTAVVISAAQETQPMKQAPHSPSTRNCRLQAPTTMHAKDKALQTNVIPQNLYTTVKRLPK